MISPRSRLAAVLVGALALSVTVASTADARRGGSFGSRGSRTYSAPPPTATSPGYTRPVERSMTAPPAAGAAARPANAAAPRPGAAPQQRPRFGGLGGLGGGLLAGLVTGGLIGAMLGHGFGGLGGLGGMGSLFATLLQVGLIALVVMLAIRFFRRRRQPALATAGASYGSAYDAPSTYTPRTGANAQWSGGGQAQPEPAPAPQDESVEIGVTMADRTAFERMLTEVQDAFGREDYGRLRELTTPEIMSYLSEELSQNATRGQRNEVSGTRLLQADISEAWREGDADYATAAFRYESIDLMRDRQSGKVVAGDPNTPTQAVEHWTFVRRAGSDWKLSAIQEA